MSVPEISNSAFERETTPEKRRRKRVSNDVGTEREWSSSKESSWLSNETFFGLWEELVKSISDGFGNLKNKELES